MTTETIPSFRSSVSLKASIGLYTKSIKLEGFIGSMLGRRPIGIRYYVS